MKEKIQKFAIYLLIGIFALGFVILRAGLKNNSTPFIIIGIVVMGIIVVFAGIYFLLSGSKRKKNETKYHRELELFKQSARKIKVNLEEVEIKVNSWTDEIVTDNSTYGGLNQFAGYHESNIMKVDRNLNSVNITIPIDGKELNYVVNIEMDTTTLRMLFAIKKETILYFDGEEQYLDLEFLN